MKTLQAITRISVLAGSLLLLCCLGLAQAATLPVSAAPPITVAFDHLTTGFELDGVHRDLACESCHVNAMFKGTPRDCGTCHSPNTVYNAVAKPRMHIASSNNCSACHNTIAFRPALHFSHTDVLAACATCHNGSTAQGEGPTHPATSQACEACHTTLSWAPPKAVDHKQIPLAVAGFCIICHNGTQAAGKPKTHITTSLECGDCHLTNTWASATFNHTGITTGCVSCHDGVKAVGKQGGHMPTTNSCESCHTTGLGTVTPSWAPALFIHTQMTVATCQTCHSGTVKVTTGFVSGQPTNHVPPIPSKVDCSVCHGNTPTAETWDVIAVGIPALHSGLNVNNCLMCHAGQTFAGVPKPYTPMATSGISPTNSVPLSPQHIPVLAGTDCSACHSAAYLAGGFGPATAMSGPKHAFVTTACNTCHEAGRSFYTGGGTPLQLRPANHSSPEMAAPNDCSGCHQTTDWNSTQLPAGHMPNPGNQACATCHVGLPGNYTTLAANAVLHTGISGNCVQCHGATSTLTFYNNFPVKSAALTPAHIPFIPGTDCNACHTGGNYAVGGFASMTMTAATHAFVSTSCNICHETGRSFYPGASLNLQDRPADHNAGNMLAPNDCSACHTTANWNSTVLPAGHMPNPANQTCSVCHTSAPTDYKSGTLASYPVLHTGITTNCGLCHGSTSATLTFYNNYPVKSARLSPAHIPYLTGTDCAACHGTTFAAGGFAGTTMNAAKHAFVATACNTCHEVGLSFYPGAALNLETRPADHTAPTMVSPNDCKNCHQTTDWSSAILPAGHMPNPANKACNVCHTGLPANYTTLAANPILHSGITSGCAQCHGTNTTLTFYNNYPVKSSLLSPAHIPILAGTDCSSCHGASNFAVGGFAGMTMTSAAHAFVSTSCNICHEAGLSFYPGAGLNLQGRPANHNAGTQLAPNDCNLCHTTLNWNATALPANHLPNPGGLGCTSCHTTLAAGATDFTQYSLSGTHGGPISGSCSICHSGGSWVGSPTNINPKSTAGLSPAHIQVLAGVDCSACHNPTSTGIGGFAGTTMSAAKHAFVTTACNTCHEAGLSFYPGAALKLDTRPADHTAPNMLAPNDCKNCHQTTDWTSAIIPAGHMPNPSNLACTVCHTGLPTSYTTLASNAVLHTGITANCTQCHGSLASTLTFYNNYAVKSGVLTPAHIPVLAGIDCGACHKSTTFAAGGFAGMTMTSATHAYVATTCNTCHETGRSFYPGAALNLQLRPADHTSGNMVSPNDCSGCHTTVDWNSTTLPTGHMPNPSNLACATCHTAAPANYTTLASNAVLHTGITGNCAQCHGSLATTLTFYNNYAVKSGVLTPAHIPVLAGTDCGACHVSTTYAVGGFAGMTMTAATHAYVATTCNTCHETGRSFYPGAALNLQLRPADHTTGTMASPNDCNLCHTTANWNSTTLPSGHMPNPGNQACATCHTAAPTNYKTLASNTILHTGITKACITCHGAPNATPPVYYLNFTPKSAVLTPVHIPTSTTACEACHAATNFTAFSGTTMSSAKHTSMFAVIGSTCNACHNKVTPALSFYGVTNLQTRPGDHSSGNKLTQDCASCHNTTSWGGGGQVRAVSAKSTAATGTVGTVVTAAAATNASAAAAATPALPHTGVTANCVSCHDGQLATGKGPKHIASDNQCQNCHTTAAWLPARYDHRGLTASCVSCHNGAVATGKPSRHIQTNLDCTTCHGTLAWLPVVYSHVGVTATCQSCHNGHNAEGKPLQHVASIQDCSQCHNVFSWTVITPSAPLRPLVPRLNPRTGPKP